MCVGRVSRFQGLASRLQISSMLTLLALQPLASHAGTVTTTNLMPDAEYSYAIAFSDSILVNGSQDAAAQFRRDQPRMRGEYIWFRRAEKSYFIADPTLVRRAADILKVQIELGRGQAALGEAQAQLGHEQTRLARREQTDSAADPLQALAALGKRLSVLRTQQDSPAAQAEIAAIQEQVRQVERELNRRHDGGDTQTGLANEQSSIGAAQGSISDEQANLFRRTSPQMKALFDEALGHNQARSIE
jgi:hypothetical protein